MKVTLRVLLLSLAACSCSHVVDLDQTIDTPVLTNGLREGEFVFSALRLPRPFGNIWVDSERVYWIDDRQLRSCVYDDCPATLASYDRSGGPLVSDSRFVYFGGIGGPSGYDYGWTLLRCPKLGCADQRIPFVHDSLQVQPVIDGDYLYWISTFDIYRCPLTGCGETPEVVVPSYSPSGDVNYGLTAASGYLYWLARTLDSSDPSERAQLFRAPLDGSSPAVALTPAAPSGGYTSDPSFTVQDDTLYWLDDSTRILSCPASGCVGAPEVVLDTASNKSTLRSDASGLYWIDRDTGSLDLPPGGDSVMFHPFLGATAGLAEQVLTHVGVTSFVLDARYLYWFSLNEGSAASVDPDLVDSIARSEKPQRPAP